MTLKDVDWDLTRDVPPKADEKRNRAEREDRNVAAHGAPECLDPCELSGGMMCRALGGQPKDAALYGDLRRGMPSSASFATTFLPWLLGVTFLST